MSLATRPALSVVIPAHNEAEGITPTLRALSVCLREERIEHEFVVVNDHSTDETGSVLDSLIDEIPELRPVENPGEGGFGLAVRVGLDQSRGDAVAVLMADASDSPQDLVRFYRTRIEQDVDCVFGTRFSRRSHVEGYPQFKLLLNRAANKFIQILFGLRYNDVTNAFKLYGRRALEGSRPFLSHHFNLTVELPLKVIVRGYSFAVVPNDWSGRKTGESKLKLKEMGSRYLFIVLYCLIEKWLSRGDYKVREPEGDS